MIELSSRNVVQVGVPSHPTDAWIAQQRRHATPCEHQPRSLIRATDRKDGPMLARLAATSQSEVLTTPFHAPRANAIYKRFLGSVRRESLDHHLIFHERHLGRVPSEYVGYFLDARPPRGINHAIPAGAGMREDPRLESRTMVSQQVLGGLHTAYRLAA